jgi:hypothetical protein
MNERVRSTADRLSQARASLPVGVPDGWRDALQKIAKHAPPVNCAAKTEVEKLALIAVHALIAFSAPQFSKPTDHQSAKVGTAAPTVKAEQVQCDTCHGQGEICVGQQTFGYMSMQPPEPIMEVCPECGGEAESIEPAPTQDERELPDYLNDALDNLVYDNYERSQAGSRNRQADADLIRAALAARPAQTEQQPVAWLPYLSDGADGVTGHYAIARKNPAGYREVWNLRRHHWAAFSDEVLTMDEALAILEKLEMPTAPIAQTAQQSAPERVSVPKRQTLNNLARDGELIASGWNACLDEFSKLNPSIEQVSSLLEWAVSRWEAEVSLRPLHNVHRRPLDDTWRQVIRRIGGDDKALCGPAHDELIASHQRGEA